MRNKNRILVLLALLAGGCNAPTLVDASRPATIGAFSVMPQTSWNQLIPDKGHTVWTQNGTNLDSVHFVVGVQDGQPLYPIFGLRTAEQVLYRDNMLPNDVQDLVVSTLQKEGYDNVRAGSLSPCPFAGGTGFCFDLDFANTDGLLMKGKVAARKSGGSLDLFEFRAPAEYYFPNMQPTVDKVFASASGR